MAYIIVAIALGLTFIALKVGLILFRVAASVAWLAMLVYVVFADAFSLADPWTVVLAFGLFSMVVACITLQIVTEVEREKGPRVESLTWKEWGKKPKDEVISRSRAVKEERKKRLEAIRERTGR